MDLWLSTDETEEAISALEFFAKFCTELIADKYRWKWAIIALHNSVQNFMVLALRQGDGLPALDEKNAKKVLEARQGKREYPEPRLASFPALYEKIKDDQIMSYCGGRQFIPTADHDRAIKNLNELRNEFIHFPPQGWGLDIAGSPRVCLLSLDVISFIGWESRHLIFYADNQESRAKKALEKSRAILNDVKKQYDPASSHNRGPV
jgi:hypothetical protein